MTELDWAAAHERLARAREALEQPRSAESARAVLQARARALAARETGDGDGPRLTELLVFHHNGERHAIEARHVLEALPLGVPTRLPGTPPFLLGVINHRARILPVYDVGALLGRAAEPEPRHAIAVEAEGMTFGIAAAEVEESAGFALDALSPPPEGRVGAIRGVTPKLVTVLDLEALAADPRLVVDDGVTR